MATATLTLTDLPPTGDGRSYVRIQLDTNPPVEQDKPITDMDLTLAQVMGRVAVAAVMEALEAHFHGAPVIEDLAPDKDKAH